VSTLNWPPFGPDRCVHHAEVGSTNTEALQLASAGWPGGTWVVADRQTQGRGRSGRAWVSAPGNLHASLILRDVFPLEKAAQLALVSGVAVHDAVSRCLQGVAAPPIELKWPNDLLCGRRKVGGILVESSVARRDQGALAVIGVGLNLAHDPGIEGLAATHLAAFGASIAPLKLLAFLDESMQEWIAQWASGHGFGRVREAWLARSLPPGVGLTVNSGRGAVNGVFAGLDPDGALLLTNAAGALQTVTFGDVALQP
jgi:BirA family biotin operon repressor/biotin-[acetyl-CoA-carboxylase] ligase